MVAANGDQLSLQGIEADSKNRSARATSIKQTINGNENH